MRSTTFSPFTTSVCHAHTMRYMYHLLVTLIRKLCAIVRPILNWSSHSSVARLLNRLWSFILRASRPSTSTSRANDAGGPISAILLPSDAALIQLFTTESSPREIEEGLHAPAIYRNSIEEAPQTDSSPRAIEDNDGERELLPSEPNTSHIRMRFLSMLPLHSERYDQKVIMCVSQTSNIQRY